MPSVPAFPKDLPVKAFCNDEVAAPEVLCTKTLTSGFKMPKTISEFKEVVIDALIDLIRVAMTSEQSEQATKLPYTRAVNFLGVTDYFTTNLKEGNLRRWMVLPPHFLYGSNGMTFEAAKFFLTGSKKTQQTKSNTKATA